MKKILALIIVLGSTGCSGNTLNSEGYLDFSVSSPKTTLSENAARAKFKKIKLAVSGENLPASKSLTFNLANPALSLAVPPGKKKIEVIALDSSGKEIASKTEEIMIRSAVRYEIVLNLEQPTAEAASEIKLRVEKQIHPELKDPNRKPVKVGVKIKVESK